MFNINTFNINFIVLMLVSTAVNSAPVTSLDVSGGFFNMNAPIEAGGESPIGAFTMDMGSYQGDETALTGGDVSSGYVTWAFGFFGDMTGFSAAASNLNGVIGGGPAPSGVTDDVAGTITLDLSSFFVSWKASSFNLGMADIVGTYDAITGAFTVNWSKQYVGGAFDGRTSYWELSGTANVSAIPVPAAAWLFCSGLIGLVSVARCRKFKY